MKKAVAILVVCVLASAWASMAAFDGRLFCSTLPSAKVHALEAGPCATFDREIPTGWQHVAAVKQGGLLRLYVNGKQVAESRRFEPARFYRRALGAAEIRARADVESSGSSR